MAKIIEGYGSSSLAEASCPEQRPEPPRCLPGFANVDSLAQVMGGSEFLSVVEEKKSSFVGGIFVFLQISILFFLVRPLINDSLVWICDLLRKKKKRGTFVSKDVGKQTRLSCTACRSKTGPVFWRETWQYL